jgi:hypothetical protein
MADQNEDREARKTAGALLLGGGAGTLVGLLTGQLGVWIGVGAGVGLLLITMARKVRAG